MTQPVAQPWPAPHATRPVDAVVELPGSKSQTNRALVLAALAEGRSVLRRPLRSRDSELMVGALRTLGVEVEDLPGGDWAVTGCPGPFTPVGERIDVGNAGTVARFVPALAALSTGTVLFDGDPRVRERPVGPLLVALRELGAVVEGVDGEDRLPVRVTGSGTVRGGAVTFDSSGSSQLVSALLLAGPRFESGVEVTHAGGPFPSRQHVAMTMGMLADHGAEVSQPSPDVWQVSPGPLHARTAVVEPDLSSAAAYLAAALVTGGRVTVAGWPLLSVQPGTVLPGLLERMGGRVVRGHDSVTVSGGDRLVGLDADLRDAPELTPVLAALAALASTPTRLTGVGHIRLQETDRIAALAGGIVSLGGDVTELPDGLEIRPRPLHGGLLRSHDDHRIAMAWAVLGLGVPGVLLDDVETTRKTIPDFVLSWERLLS